MTTVTQTTVTQTTRFATVSFAGDRTDAFTGIDTTGHIAPRPINAG